MALLPALAASLGHVLWRASARVTGALDGTVAPTTDIHGYAVLLALGDEGVPRSQQWVADAVALSRTTLTKVAARLVAAGLVERVRNPADRRAWALTRTPAGAEAVARWEPLVERLQDAVSGGLDSAEREELHDLLLAVTRPHLSPEAPSSLLASTGFLVTRLHARMHADLAAALRELEVEPRHLGTFRALRSAGPFPQAELARHLGTSGPTVVEIVDHLERLGALERRRPEADRRTQVLHLLPRGEALLTAADERAEAVISALLAPLSPDQRDRLRALLVRFVEG
ncbi:MarR family transcriptional regulator [Nocardioides flavescens]|uniref:MarR family transcriptional regulator n=1 Tax=Nocardioides flavescens TaxID=2691959 RepID=UPI001369599F